MTQTVTTDNSSSGKKEYKPQVVERIIVTGNFELESAAHFGSGETGDSDMMLVRSGSDEILIPGTSIAGACRSYLTYHYIGRAAFDFLQGSNYEPKPNLFEATKADKKLREEERKSIKLLFGDTVLSNSSRKKDKEQNPKKPEIFQSALIISDAYATKDLKTDLRDGVKIDPRTGQAKDTAKYDYEVVERTTVFTLRFELVIREEYHDQANDLKQLLSTILEAFNKGKIRLGAKTRRGLGRGAVKDWRITELNFTNKEDILTWLSPVMASNNKNGVNNLDNWRKKYPPLESKEAYFEIDASFRLKSSLLIRTYVEEEGLADAVQVKSRGKPVVPGTSAGGAIRQRAEKILYTLEKVDRGQNDEDWKSKLGYALARNLFGYVDEGDKTQPESETMRQRASRFYVEENLVDNTAEEIQSRVKIDRFTGGVIEGGLFDEAAIWSNPGLSETNWQLKCTIFEPEDYEIGLLLLVLKDMWLGDLSLGGGANIGRGVLQGSVANLTLRRNPQTGKETKWVIRTTGDATKPTAITVEGSAQDLEKYVMALKQKLGIENAAN